MEPDARHVPPQSHMPALTYRASGHSPPKRSMISLLFPIHVCNHPLPGRSYVKERRQEAQP
ncbi:hypothetical protein LY76DRAFT_258248 [Colletotrichum caudatum]|nr:hypothetical protein LY76DRAFT_258248 [Colletotrichum caudatum]